MNHQLSGEICQVGRAIRLPEFAPSEAGAASFAQPRAGESPGESPAPPLSNCLRGADTSRRVFLKCGLGAGVAGALIPNISGRTLGVPCDQAIFDERFEDPRVFAAGATDRGIPSTAIRGDVTRLFFDDLDLRWKQEPMRLAGYTTPASLFCLDLLARDRGMRVSHCVINPSVKLALGLLDAAAPRGTAAAQLPSNDSSRLVFWIIEPKVRSCQHPAAGA